MKQAIIAIDGPAASGKSTVAKEVAKVLQYKYIDSGAMYRCVTLYYIDNKLSKPDLIKQLTNIKIEFDLENHVFLNGVDVSEKIRSNEVSQMVYQVATIEEVRTHLVNLQQEYGQTGGIVMDGRDIGSVVFPKAQVKIYQSASVKTRALRRHNENQTRQIDSNLAEISAELEKRDYEDMNREIAPLIKANDAIELDTSNWTIAQVVARIVEIHNEKVSR